ncbi:hypothetical protein V9T40_003799 [Parthenolecanium corni]|uniref:Uncharacterized protein n=1 Tax=Parthenolecanium corni TaxID=536013 RepID=A0AAN9YAQ3_9HEMI
MPFTRRTRTPRRRSSPPSTTASSTSSTNRSVLLRAGRRRRFHQPPPSPPSSMQRTSAEKTGIEAESIRKEGRERERERLTYNRNAASSKNGAKVDMVDRRKRARIFWGRIGWRPTY